MTAIQVLTLPLAAIRVEDRLREVDPDRAAELALSLRERGQLTPIEVAPEDGEGRYRLIYGAHRVAAARVAGLVTVRAVLFDGTRDEERLREIDENLYRRELSPLDQASFLAERRAIYERLHGPVAPGRRNRAKLAQLSFFDDVAGRFGLPARTVKRALWRRRTITGDAWSQLAGTRHAEKGAVLDAIARLPTERQVEVVGLLRSGAARTVGVALAALGAAPAVDPNARQLQALTGAWQKAGDGARSQFLAILAGSHARALSAALAKLPARNPTPRKVPSK